MIVAVEDPLSEAVVRRVVSATRPDLIVSGVIRKNGKSYIKRRIQELNRSAQSLPVFVLIDLDQPEPCPADLIEAWLPAPRGPKLLFRVAVMEIESWVMADRHGLSRLLSVPLHRIPEDPDNLAQPKEHLVSIARKSKRREILDDFVPAPGDTRKVGPAFNARLEGFVADTWNLQAAAETSPSLKRTVLRLASAFQ